MRGPTFFASLQPGRDRHEQFFPHLRFAPYFVALPIPLALPTLDDVDDQTVGHLFETWALAHVFALHEDPEGFQRGFLGGVGHANHGRREELFFFSACWWACPFNRFIFVGLCMSRQTSFVVDQIAIVTTRQITAIPTFGTFIVVFIFIGEIWISRNCRRRKRRGQR